MLPWKRVPEHRPARVRREIRRGGGVQRRRPRLRSRARHAPRSEGGGSSRLGSLRLRVQSAESRIASVAPVVGEARRTACAERAARGRSFPARSRPARAALPGRRARRLPRAPARGHAQKARASARRGTRAPSARGAGQAPRPEASGTQPRPAEQHAVGRRAWSRQSRSMPQLPRERAQLAADRLLRHDARRRAGGRPAQRLVRPGVRCEQQRVLARAQREDSARARARRARPLASSSAVGGRLEALDPLRPVVHLDEQRQPRARERPQVVDVDIELAGRRPARSRRRCSAFCTPAASANEQVDVAVRAQLPAPGTAQRAPAPSSARAARRRRRTRSSTSGASRSRRPPPAVVVAQPLRDRPCRAHASPGARAAGCRGLRRSGRAGPGRRAGRAPARALGPASRARGRRAVARRSSMASVEPQGSAPALAAQGAAGTRSIRPRATRRERMITSDLPMRTPPSRRRRAGRRGSRASRARSGVGRSDRSSQCRQRASSGK